jgi:hypothetical protein
MDAHLKAILDFLGLWHFKKEYQQSNNGWAWNTNKCNMFS